MRTLPGALLGTAPPGGGSCGAQDSGCMAPAARLLGSDAHTLSPMLNNRPNFPILISELSHPHSRKSHDYGRSKEFRLCISK